MGALPFPFPIAALHRRATNAKSPKERHDTAYFAWEASIRVVVAARPPEDRSKLAMPSIGSFVAAVAWSDAKLEAPPLLALHALFTEVVTGKAERPRAIAPARLLGSLAAYRNVVIGHGSTRAPSFYEEAARVLLDALVVAWRSGVFLDEETQLVFVDTVTIDPSGQHLGRLVDLSSETPLVIDPRGTKIPDDVRPNTVQTLRAGAFRSLHPWLLYRETELREQMLFFNGRGKGSQYLDYVGGEALKGRALADAFPGIEDDVQSMLRSSTPSAPESGKDVRPDAFGDYTLLGKLGEGGMGVVYLARQESLGRLVALKMLSPSLVEDSVAAARFRREIKALARCDHPSVVKILASGVQDRTHYYAMELVEGADLAAIRGVLGETTTLDTAITEASSAVRKAKEAASIDVPAVAAGATPNLPGDRDRQLARLFRDAALAVQALHDAGILHRDLKPANLMVTATDHRLVVMDLGLAAASNDSRSITRDKSSLLGTLRYMPPEQLQRNLLDLDARADVYALGATFYEMCTGKPFLEGETEAQLVAKVLHGAPVPPRKANPRMPADLAKILEKATQKDRSLRYADAKALASDLDAFLAGRPVSARAGTPIYRLSLAVRRHKAITALVIVAVGGAAWAAKRAAAPHDCVAGDTKDCTAQCERGNGPSCFTLGIMYQQASGVAADLAMAARMFERACQRGHAQACHEWGKALETGGGVAADYPRARAEYERACELGSAQGCSDLAIMLAHARGGPLDTARAITLYQKACDNGFPNACSNLGLHYERGEGVPQDEAKARSFYDRACTGGSSIACGVLATSLVEGRGGPKDEARAAKLYDSACTAGDRYGCFGLALLLADGRGVPHDDARARTLFERACRERVARACVGQGKLEPNERRALQLYEEACNADEPEGCRLAAAKTSDPARAFGYYEHGCEAEDAESCMSVALALREGRGVAKDEARAKTLAEKACAAGLEKACATETEPKTKAPAPPPKPKPFAPKCECAPGDPLCHCL